MLWLVISLIVPALLVILFTRVTYLHYVGTLLTILLLIVSYFKGYTTTITEIVLDIISVTVGFLYSKRMVEAGKKNR